MLKALLLPVPLVNPCSCRKMVLPSSCWLVRECSQALGAALVVAFSLGELVDDLMAFLEKTTLWKV